MTDVDCDTCYAEDPDTAWRRYLSAVERTAVLLDESHFIVAIGRCRACQQSYVSIFTELIDWTGGEDAQHRILLPITTQEAVDLVQHGEGLDPGSLGALGDGRRYLVVDWPSHAAQAQTRWASGQFQVAPGH